MSSNRLGISVAVPLIYGPVDGPYNLNKTVGQAIKQNFKTLILTAPGERIMDPQFGVGLHQFLFEPMSGPVMDDLVQKIREQKDIYIPALNIETVEFKTSDENSTLAFNQVQVVITYNIAPYAGSDQLTITSTMTI
jgi:phage baseplate assembly protein W